MNWILLYVLGSLLLVIAAYLVRTKYLRSSRLQSLTEKCLDQRILHVITETEFGLVHDAVDMISALMDMSSCPTRIAMHVLEPVASVKAEDILTPALEKACVMGPNYGTYFREQILVQKIHRSRQISGLKCIQHVLEHSRLSIGPEDIIVWFPAHLRPAKGWDAGIRADLAQARRGALLSYPLMPLPASARDVERFFLPEAEAMAGFAKLSTNLDVEALPMSRPANTPAYAVSLRFPLVAPASVFSRLCTQPTIREDLALSLHAFASDIQIMHGGSALGFHTMHRLPNRRSNVYELRQMLQTVDSDKAELWMEQMALEDGDDVTVFGRAYMGMTHTPTLSEILVKWGSEAAYETEKEALKYG